MCGTEHLPWRRSWLGPLASKLIRSYCVQTYNKYNKSNFLRDFSKGNIVNYETAVFETQNVTSYMRTAEDLCSPRRPGLVAFPIRRNYTLSRSTCHKFGGDILIVQDQQKQNAVKDYMTNFKNCERTSPDHGNFLNKSCLRIAMT